MYQFSTSQYWVYKQLILDLSHKGIHLGYDVSAKPHCANQPRGYSFYLIEFLYQTFNYINYI